MCREKKRTHTLMTSNIMTIFTIIVTEQIEALSQHNRSLIQKKKQAMRNGKEMNRQN